MGNKAGTTIVGPLLSLSLSFSLKFWELCKRFASEKRRSEKKMKRNHHHAVQYSSLYYKSSFSLPLGGFSFFHFLIIYFHCVRLTFLRGSWLPADRYISIWNLIFIWHVDSFVCFSAWPIGKIWPAFPLDSFSIFIQPLSCFIFCFFFWGQTLLIKR